MKSSFKGKNEMKNNISYYLIDSISEIKKIMKFLCNFPEPIK
jgi:hypothetical protein